MRHRSITWMACGVMLAVVLGVAHGQSSSLLISEPAPRPRLSLNNQIGLAQPHLQHVSYFAVTRPAVRQFAIHDLVTIIVRESSNASSEATLETEKDVGVKGTINAFPDLQLKHLIEGTIKPSTLESGDQPQVDVSVSQDFEGEGEYERKDDLTLRITARVVDIKPNGMLSLEGRKYIRNDDEKLTVTITGYCRPKDVTIDNTVLSTQLGDLRIDKTHEGELRKSSKKGLFTKVLEFIFNF